MFLTGAAFALGGRESDLARVLGVSRATLSSWKARGAIPEAHLRWFSEEFVPAVLSRIAPAPGEDFRNAGVPVALHLARITDFNPFGLVGMPQIDLIDIFALHMGGLVRMGHFVLQRVTLKGPVEEWELLAAHTLKDIVREAAPRVKPRRMVSQ